MGLEVKGYAKINLYLDVVGLLDGTYHAVKTVMQSVTLCDTLFIDLRDDGKIVITSKENKLPLDNTNIAYKAADLFFSELGKKCGCDIFIDKKIPMAAGLGGGSADAAATLIGLNRLFGEPKSVAQLCDIGKKIGADVPFCIKSGAAYAEGRGDELYPFPSLKNCFVVVACGGEGVSTPWAYRKLDETFDSFSGKIEHTPTDIDSLREALSETNILSTGEFIYNIFEAPIFSERPVAAMIKKKMLDGGGLFAMMSGSGPSVFGIFSDKDMAEKVAALLRGEGHFAGVYEPRYSE